MKLTIKKDKAKEKIMELWLEYSGDEILLMSATEYNKLREFRIYADKGWQKISNGNLDPKEK